MSLYPTPSGHRMAYDRDGSAGFYINPLNAVSTIATADLQKLNDETSSTFYSPADNDGFYIGFIFPELRDIAGYYLAVANGVSQWTTTVAVSSNTTNGLDGTWTNLESFLLDAYANTVPGYRSSIRTGFTPTGVKAFRFSHTAGGNKEPGTCHIYGQPSSGQNPDSLRIWQPVTNAEVTTVFDFGDITRGTAATQSFRVHNQSATKTAHTITLSMEALSDSSPSQIGQYQLSTDNVTFANTISIPDLGPGATSAVLYVRDTVSVSASLSLWAARVVAAAGSFI